MKIGTVTSFSEETRYGFIDKNVFFYYTFGGFLDSDEVFKRKLPIGYKVEVGGTVPFISERTDKGLRAKCWVGLVCPKIEFWDGGDLLWSGTSLRELRRSVPKRKVPIRVPPTVAGVEYKLRERYVTLNGSRVEGDVR